MKHIVKLLAIMMALALLATSMFCMAEVEHEEVVLELEVHASETLDAALTYVSEKFHEEYPWITVNVSCKGQFDTRQEAQDVDIVEVSNEGTLEPEWAVGFRRRSIPSAVDNGALLDLSADWNSRFIPASLELCSYNGGQYGFTIGSYATNGVFYNKAIFDEYGLSEPQTWDEFIEICQTLLDNGVAPLTCGIADGWPQTMFYNAIVSATEEDAEKYVEQLWNGERKWNDEKSMENWERIAQVTPYWEENVSNVDCTTAVAHFVTGKVAMLATGSWDEPLIADADVDFEYSYFGIPGDKPYLLGKFDSCIGAASYTKHPEEVMMWFEFWSRPEIYAEFCKILSIMPAQSITVDNAFLASMSDKLEDFGFHWEFYFIAPTGTGSYAQNCYLAATNLPVYGGTIETVEEIANLAQQDWDLALSQLD